MCSVRGLKSIFTAVFAFVILFSAAEADQISGSGSLLRKYQPAEEVKEPQCSRFFDLDGLFLDEIEDGFFDRGWKKSFVTGDTREENIIQDGSFVHFDLPKRETYAYVTNTCDPVGDAYVEAEFLVDDAWRATYGIMCRVSDAGWYELRVQTTGDISEMGSYRIYKYDPQLKEKKGKNPYVLIHPDNDFYKTVDLKNGIGKRNVIGMSCEGNVIRVFINGKEQVPLKGLVWSDDQFVRGGFGAGVQVFGDSSAEINLAYIAAEKRYQQ